MILKKDGLVTSRGILAFSGLLLALVSAGALAAQYKLYINKDQSASNVIVFEDNMGATVTHTNEGMELVLPGVEVALRCKSTDTNNTTDSCVIAIEAAALTGGSSTRKYLFWQHLVIWQHLVFWW